MQNPDVAPTEEQILIDAPHMVSRARRMADAAVTGLLWALYSYLWAPLISLLAWLLGFEFAYDVLVRAGGMALLKDVILVYGTTILGIISSIIVWSLVNKIRFAHRERRHALDPVSDEEVAEFYAIDAQQLGVMRNSRVVRLAHDELGVIQAVAAEELPGWPSDATTAGHLDTAS